MNARIAFHVAAAWSNTWLLSPLLISDAVNTKPAVITLFRAKTYLYCPVVKETIQQDSVIWDVLDKPSA